MIQTRLMITNCALVLSRSRQYEYGSISDTMFKKCFKGARKFLVEAVTYLLKWCPFEEELLVHATWLKGYKQVFVR